jgi:D-xylose transport system permease protein
VTTTEPTPETPLEPTSDDAVPNSVGAVFSNYIDRVRGGDVGALPAMLGLVVLVIVFSILRPDTFTNSFNFANLINQAAAVVVIAMGLVFVLLLGEIDLSAGFTAGTGASTLCIVLTRHNWPWFPSILVGLATGAFIGLCIGLLVARLGIPSFVVTLAAFLGLQGVMLQLIGEGGTISVRNSVILAVDNKNLPVWLGWVLAVAGLLAATALQLRTALRRRAKGLPAPPNILIVLRLAGVAVPILLATYYLSIERSPNPSVISLKGVPIVVVVLAGLLLILTFALSKTAWGRHVYAVGGNAEAARRAGINVARVRLSCFIICSTVATIAGVILASRDNSVSATTGGSSTLLYAVGAAVIGGTSLFGGKGRVVDALIGGFLVAIIDNGMGLLNQPSGRVYIVTGVVLLLAASVDAISRRRAAATGRF